MALFTPFHFVAIAVGAALGAWLRWLLALWLNRYADTIPWGTFTANMIGGYLIGLVLGVVAANPEWPPFWRLFIVTGFLGGLTTFSAFSAETVAFLEEGRLAMAAIYSAVSLAGSLILTLLGLYTARVLQS
jgi:CrcB protein